MPESSNSEKSRQSYFHYTSLQALLGMLTNRHVWFSSLAFMNDAMEGYDLGRLLNVLSNDTPGSNDDEYKGLIDAATSAYLRHQYCFSATSLKDDLTQWRAYSELGQGVCIEFDDSFLQNEHLQKKSCVYDDAEKNRLIKSTKKLAATGDELNRILGNSEETMAYLGELIDHLSRFKHSSFATEVETRWILSLNGLTDSQHPIQFRSHRLGIVSYVEVPIEIGAIRTVRLGPQVPNQNKGTLEDLLTLKQCPGIVLQSEVTLR